MRRLGLLVLLAGIGVTCVLLTVGRAKDGELVARDQWFGAYLGENKLGYGRLVATIEKGAGPPVALVRLSADIRAVALGGSGVTKIRYELIERMDAQTLAPKSIDSRTDVDGAASRTRIRFTKKGAEWEITQGGTTERGTVAPEPGKPVVADLGFLTRGAVKKESPRRFFNFMTLRVTDGPLAPPAGVLPKGAVAGVSCLCTPGTMTVYYDAAGQIVTAFLPMGVSLRPQTAEKAKDMGPPEYVPPLEMGIGFGAKASRPIADPTKVTHLKAVIHGLRPGSVVAIEGRQKVTEDTNGIHVEVSADDVRRAYGDALPLPVKGPDPALVAAEDFLEVGSPKIVAVTRQAVGDEKNSARAAQRISEWIDKNLGVSDQLAPIRSAVNILDAGAGVCRDYATLYVAMARTAGIPSRIVEGMVAAKDGFYLHAWAESYVGRWVPVDATRARYPVDATHISLTRGSVADVWDTSKYVGVMTVDIEDLQVGEPAPPSRPGGKQE